MGSGLIASVGEFRSYTSITGIMLKYAIAVLSLSSKKNHTQLRLQGVVDMVRGLFISLCFPDGSDSDPQVLLGDAPCRQR